MIIREDESYIHLVISFPGAVHAAPYAGSELAQHETYTTAGAETRAAGGFIVYFIMLTQIQRSDDRGRAEAALRNPLLGSSALMMPGCRRIV